MWMVAKFSWQPRVCRLKSPLFISFQPSALQFNWWSSLKSFTSSIDKPSFFLILSEISFPVTALIIVYIFKDHCQSVSTKNILHEVMLSFISAYLREVLTRFFILSSSSDLTKYKKCEQSLDGSQALMLSSTGSDRFASRVVEN